MNEISEKESLQNSIETYFHSISRRAVSIYIVLLGLVAIMLAVIPFLKVPVMITARGVIKTEFKSSQINAPKSGEIESIRLTEGDYLKKGTILFTIKTDILENELNLNRIKQKKVISDMEDLKSLLKDGENIKSEKYAVEYDLFKTKSELLKSIMQSNNDDIKRHRSLYDDSLISERKFIDIKLNYQTAYNNYQIFCQKTFSQWRKDIAELEIKRDELESGIKAILTQINESEVKAPFDGYVYGLHGYKEGSYVNKGSNILSLLPDTNLIAEIFIEPHKIIWIKKGMELKLLIDSYDYQYWGSIDGVCNYISEDCYSVNNSFLYLVKSKIPGKYLSKKNKKAEIKPGMTLTAQFTAAEITLLELITKKMNAYLNPGIISNTKK